MKKKLTAVLLALTLACLALPGALAQDAEEGQTYTLEELGLTVTLPEELIVLAPGIVPEETAAEKMDWTVGDVKDWYADLEALDIYLAAVPWGINWELDLGATYDEENSWYDFRSVPKAGRQHLMDKMMENSGQNGLYWESVSPYETDQALFFRLAGFDETGTQIVRYYTTRAGWDIRVDLLNFHDEVDKWQEDILQDMLDTARFSRGQEVTLAQRCMWALIYAAMVLPRPVILLLDMLAGLLYYCLPLMIYRFGVRRSPMERRKARKLVLIWQIAVFWMVKLLIRWIFEMFETDVWDGWLWAVVCGFVNYFLLTRGGKKKARPAPAKVGPLPAADPAPEPDDAQAAGPADTRPADTQADTQAAPNQLPPVLFCRHCGARLRSDSLYCHQCGARVREE